MWRILDAFARAEKFTAFFDHFDDLIILDEGSDGVALSFFQMKAATNSAFTPASLARQSSKEVPRSIAGKAYFNIHQFGPLVRQSAIVSNQHLNAKLCDGKSITSDHGCIKFSDLSAKDLKRLTDAIGADFPAQLATSYLDLLTFERIPLDLVSFRSTLQGRVLAMLDKVAPDKLMLALPLYESLLTEISRCTGTVSKAPKDLVELRAQKGLAANDLAKLMERVHARTQTPLEWWGPVEQELSARAGMGARSVQRMKNSCLAYWQRRRSGNATATSAAERARAAIASHSASLPDGIIDCLAILTRDLLLSDIRGEPYDAQAVLIVELMEAGV